MKKMIMLAAVAALLTVSACKKAETTEVPAEEKQEATEQVTEAPEAEATVQADEQTKAE